MFRWIKNMDSETRLLVVEMPIGLGMMVLAVGIAIRVLIFIYDFFPVEIHN